jgi:hypothetical protein
MHKSTVLLSILIMVGCGNASTEQDHQRGVERIAAAVEQSRQELATAGIDVTALEKANDSALAAEAPAMTLASADAVDCSDLFDSCLSGCGGVINPFCTVWCGAKVEYWYNMYWCTYGSVWGDDIEKVLQPSR